MITPQHIVVDIQDNIDGFADAIEPIQKQLYVKVSSILKELSLDAEGNIKRTSSNLSLIKQVQKELESVVGNPKYQRNVANIKSALQDAVDLQENYFNQVDDITTPPVIDKIQNDAFSGAVQSLTEAGINENVVSAATDIVSQAVTEGSDFFTMSDKLKTFIMGNDEVDGKLVSYTKQIVSDTIHGVSRNYNSIMTSKLGLEWYMYVGALMETSRPFCIAMEHKKYIHESELGKCARGEINGQKVSLQGLMPGTTKENLVDRCGGYNCTHHLVPIPSEQVPSNIRRKFEKNIKFTEDDAVDERPRRR